ncbi:kininogen-1 [Cetorhinus maximus]
MMLLYIALFTIQLLCVDLRSEPIFELEDPSIYPIDCSNPEVQIVVDLTLRKFNAEQQGSHQYALYRVTDAEAQGSLGRRYFVAFSIRESDCPVGSESLWNDCNYRAPREASTGHCESNVYIHKTQRIAEVADYNCTIHSDHHSTIEPETSQCLGCPVDLSINHPSLNEIIGHAIVKFNTESNYTNYFQRHTVYKFTHQVVAGIKYRIKFSIKETECSKEDFDDIPTECNVKTDGEKLFCNSTVLTIIWLNYTSATVDCQPEPFQLMPHMERRFAGWGPLSLPRFPQEQESDDNSNENIHTTAAEELLADDLTAPTCPGKPWKSLRQIKPAIPPSEEHES